MKSARFALLAFAAATLPALAVTPDERAACTPDVMRLCASHVPDAGAITACLRQQRASLSTACRGVMSRADRPVRAVSNRQ